VSLRELKLTAPCKASSGSSGTRSLQLTYASATEDIKQQLLLWQEQWQQQQRQQCSSSSSNGERSVAIDDDVINLTTSQHSARCTGAAVRWCLALSQQPIVLLAAGPLRFVGPHNLRDVDIHVEVTGVYDSSAEAQPVGLEALLQLPDSPNTRSLKVKCAGRSERMLQLQHCHWEKPFQQICTAIGQLTQLTSLTFATPEGLCFEQRGELLQQLCRLPWLVDAALFLPTRLMGSHVMGDGVMVADLSSMMRLSALTGLTSLKLYLGYETELPDDVAAAVALNLTRLQQLDLWNSRLQSWGPLSAVAQLTGLRSLALDGPS
jgi:hypothetical protein